MKKILTKSLLMILVVCSVMIFSETASAQRPNWANRRYTRVSVDQLITRVEERSDRFNKQFDKALDRSRLNGSRTEDNLNRIMDDLEGATDELRREFDRSGDNWWNTRRNVQRSLSIASQINTVMRSQRFNRATENNWMMLRTELNTLARVYGLPGLRAYR